MATCVRALRGYLNLAIKLSKNSNLHGEAFNFGRKTLRIRLL